MRGMLGFDKRPGNRPPGGRWKWLRHPAVRPLLQLPAESYIGLLFWTLLLQFFRSIYWYLLKSQGFGGEVFFLAYLYVPAIVLGQRFLRQQLANRPLSRALLVLGGLVGLGGQEGGSASLWQLATAGSAVGMVGLYICEGLWAGTAARRRRTSFGVAGGLVLLQAVQFGFAGRNPLVARWWGLLFLAILPGVCVSIIVLYEDLAEWEGDDMGGEEYWTAGDEGEELEALTMMSDDWELPKDTLEAGHEGPDEKSGVQEIREPAVSSAQQGVGGKNRVGVQLTSPGGNPQATRRSSQDRHNRNLSDQSDRSDAYLLEHTAAPSSESWGLPNPPAGRLGGAISDSISRLLRGKKYHLGENARVNGNADSPGDANAADDEASGEVGGPEIELGRLELSSPSSSRKWATQSLSPATTPGQALGFWRKFRPPKLTIQRRPSMNHPIETVLMELRNEKLDDVLSSPGGSSINAGTPRGANRAENNQNSWHVDVASDGADNSHANQTNVKPSSGLGGKVWNQAAGHIHLWASPRSGRVRFEEGEEVPWAEELPSQSDDGDSEVQPFRERDFKWTRGGLMRTCQMAAGSGSLLFLTHWLLSAPTTIPRREGESPWYGLLSIGALSLGLVFAAEIARKLLPKRLHGLLAWTVAAIGGIWMASRDHGPFHESKSSTMDERLAKSSQGSASWPGVPSPGTAAGLESVQLAQGLLKDGSFSWGGPMLAFAAPSLWVVMARNTYGVYPGLGLGLSYSWYLLLVLWSTALVAYQHMPGGGLVRGSVSALMVVSLVGTGLGLGRGPEVSEDERRDFSAQLGTWRAGRLTWGSGVPDRKAVAALGAICGAILAIGLALRLIYSPPFFPGEPFAPGRDLRVLSFNVQQGFSRIGANNFDALRDLLLNQRPDVVMLQETDLMHVVQGNQDLVDFLATWLGMHSLYSPPTSADTWGCAMLSVYPFHSPTFEVLPSPLGENACFQHAVIGRGRNQVHLMNAHFGDLAEDVGKQAGRLSVLLQETLSSVPSPPPAPASKRHLLERDNDQSLGPSQSPAASPGAIPTSSPGGSGDSAPESLHPAKAPGHGSWHSAPSSSASAPGQVKHSRVPLVLGGDFNTAPLTPAYQTIMGGGVYDTRVPFFGPYHNPDDRDPGAGYLLASHRLHSNLWLELDVDQNKTSDGFPIIAAFSLNP